MKIGLIGCGKQAPKHMQGLTDAGINDFVVYDVDENRASATAEKFGCNVAKNVEDIFADASITAIDICTPVDFHKPLIEQAVAANKHFFCEKPLTQSISDDEAVYKLAAENNIVGMVGYIYRFAPALEKAKELLDQNIIGTAHTAFLRIGGRGNHAAWKHQKATGGGALNEMAVHMIDLAYWMFGEIAEVQLLDSAIRMPKRVIDGTEVTCDTEDYVLIKLTARSGVEITIMADFVTPAFCQYMEVQGTNGTINASIQPEYNSSLFLIKDEGEYKAGAQKLIVNDNNLFKSQMECFVDALRNNRQPHKCRLDESIEVMKIHAKLKAAL